MKTVSRRCVDIVLVMVNCKIVRLVCSLWVCYGCVLGVLQPRVPSVHLSGLKVVGNVRDNLLVGNEFWQ